MTDEPEPPDATVVRGDVMVAGFDAQDDRVVDLERLCRIALDVLAAEGVERGRIDLHLVDVDTITELNVEHMGATGPTDVLSFPFDDDPVFDDLDGLPLLGDLVLCPAVAAEQAADHAGSVDAEDALLTIHGVLHLLGHDHAEPEETVVMQAAERSHLGALGFTHPVPS